MNSIPFDGTMTDTGIKGIVDDLAEQGWSCRDGLLSNDMSDALRQEAWQGWHASRFRQARVGTGRTKQLRNDIRNDHVQWLDPLSLTEAQQHYFNLIRGLQKAINHDLMMGLHTFEGHFAIYTPGASYTKHLDQFIGAHHRAVTSILYLNRAWQPADGGQLRLYTDENGTGDHVDLLPRQGRMITFLSGRFFHEVLPATRHRISLTGWHSIRPLNGEGLF
ncbi:MAG TPA: 2OG-Fe(II) oxygenase [Mariprofundaceae bacterium]|nr:2OG-Fe(II) oxygenase [Mariprofundaceae bacterium]